MIARAFFVLVPGVVVAAVCVILTVPVELTILCSAAMVGLGIQVTERKN